MQRTHFLTYFGSNNFFRKLFHMYGLPLVGQCLQDDQTCPSMRIISSFSAIRNCVSTHRYATRNKKMSVLSRYTDVNCTFHAFAAVWTAWITVVLRSWLQQYCMLSVSSSVHLRSTLYNLQRRGSGVVRRERVMLPHRSVQYREDGEMYILI